MSQASHEFRGSVDFNQYELRNATFQNLITPPIGPKQGQIYYDSRLDLQSPFYWNSTEWIPFGLKPVHKRYASETAMLAAQSVQIKHYIYYRTDQDIYYEYLKTGLGTIADYNPIGGGGTAYVHPAKAWIDKTTLTGATVISNLTIDALGHPTNWVTRNLTPADIGAQIAGNYEPAFSKGSLIQGPNVVLTGTLTDRLVGAGNVTIEATVPAGQVPVTESFTYVNTNMFTLSNTNVTPVYVTLNGQVLREGSIYDYTISGSTLTINEPLLIDGEISIKYYTNLANIVRVSRNIDGGAPDSVYLPIQNVDGGTP